MMFPSEGEIRRIFWSVVVACMVAGGITALALRAAAAYAFRHLHWTP